MSSTATTYLSKIQQNYPLKGQNNDSQGFRDNFHNIYGAVTAVNTQVEDLDKYTIKINGTGTFYGNTIKDVNLENTSNSLYEYELQTTDIDIDYRLGNYQVMNVTPGLHNLSVSNWPSLGKSGHLTLAIAPSDIGYTAINFSSDKFRSLDSTTTTVYNLIPGTSLFELRSEEGLTHRDSLYYVKQIGSTISTASNWNTIGTYAVFRADTTGSVIVTTTASNTGSGAAGAIALLPNITTATVGGIVTHNNGNTTFNLPNLTVFPAFYTGSKVYFTTTSSPFTLITATATNKTITVQGLVDPVNGSTATIINPVFSQPAILNLTSVQPLSTTSTTGEIKGQVYADQNTAFITFLDAAAGVTNKVQISGDRSGNPLWLGTATTATTSLTTGSTTSTVVATNQFVWNVINDSTTTVAYAYTATYVMTATTAITAAYATTASSMISGANGFGTRTVSYSAPSGGIDGDIWYQII